MIKFFRGPAGSFDKALHKDGLYFATDKGEIYLNDSVYGSEYTVTDVKMNEDGTELIVSYREHEDKKINLIDLLVKASSASAGLMSAEDKINLDNLVTAFANNEFGKVQGIVENDKVLSINEKLISATLDLKYTDKKIQLLGVNEAVIAEKCTEWGWTYEIFDSKQDAATQIDQVNSIVAQGFNAMTIQSVDMAALAPVVGEAADAGIIVVDHYGFTNEQVPTESIYQVLFGQKESGILEAEKYIELNGDSGKVALISGLTGADNAMQRVAGMEEVLAKYPGIEIVATEYCDWDTQKAQTAAENILTAHPDLKAFLVADDGMSKGVWNAIEAAGKQDSCKIASQGFYEWSKEYIKSDKFLFTITYPAGFFSRDAMDVIKNMKKKSEMTEDEQAAEDRHKIEQMRSALAERKRLWDAKHKGVEAANDR